MTALHPSPQATVPALPAAVADAPKARSRREKGSLWDGPPHGAAQLGAAIVAVACALFAVNLAILGFVWAALPMAVLTLGILIGAFLPDVLAARWAQQDAAAGEDA
jgi:hypothetical protein